jgi:hypothetical protein
VGAITETGVLQVRLTVRLCTAIYYSERFPEVSELARRALELAHQTGQAEAIGWALYARFWDGLAPERAEQAAEAMGELRPIAEQTRSVELYSESTMIGCYDFLRQGRPDLLKAALERNRARIDANGIPIYRWFAEALRTVVTVTEGRFEDAEPMIAELARSGAALDPHDLVRYAALPMLQLRHHQGRFGELVEPLRMIVTNNPGLPLWRGVLLEALAAAGQHDEAEALLAELAVEDFRWLRRDVNWLWAMSAISAACVELGNEATAAILHTRLTEIPSQSVVCGPALGFFGPVGRFIAPLATLIGRSEEATEEFARTIDRLEAVGAIPLAEATRAQRDRLLSHAETSS